MSEAIADRGKIDIGRVIQQLFAVLGRNFVTFSILALLLVGIPSAIIAYFQAETVRTEQIQFGAGFFFTWLVSVVTSAVLQGTLIYGAVQDLNGKRVSVGESLATGLRAFLPLVGLSILLAIGVTIGFILLIVPGVMLACAWVAAVPALVAERRSVFDSFSRSAELTRGNRWRIFGLFCIWIVIFFALTLVVGVIAGAAGLVTGDLDTLETSPVGIVFNVLISAFSALIGALGAAVLYVELRKAREGLGSQALADIFS